MMEDNYSTNESWGYSSELYDLENKEMCVRYEIDYMLLRCLKMFGYDNLPKTIDKRNLDLWNFCGGAVCVTDQPDGILRVFFGSFGGSFTPNYRPEHFIVTNPYLGFNKELKIIWEEGDEGDCVVIPNDDLYRGLLPLHRKFATMKVENELSLRVADILARMPTILSADNEVARQSAESFLEDIYKGKLGIIQDLPTDFVEGLKEHQLSSQMHLVFQGLIECEQYLSSAWFGAIGLNEIMNGMKKEYVSETEEKLSEDSLIPLCDNMLDCRKRSWDLINKVYGTEVIPHYASSWEDNYQEIELNHDILEAEADEGMDQDTEGEDTISEDKDESEETTDPNEEVAPSEETGGEDKQDSVEININVNVNNDESEEQKEDNEEEEVEDE